MGGIKYNDDYLTADDLMFELGSIEIINIQIYIPKKIRIYKTSFLN